MIIHNAMTDDDRRELYRLADQLIYQRRLHPSKRKAKKGQVSDFVAERRTPKEAIENIAVSELPEHQMRKLPPDVCVDVPANHAIVKLFKKIVCRIYQLQEEDIII